MTQDIFCKKCGLKKGHPGIEINSQSLCNLCRWDLPKQVLENYRKIAAIYNEFEKSTPLQNGGYDLILMLSGGKDSIYMLDKYHRENKRKILAFTVDVPFESKEALGNIDKIKDKIPVDYFVDSNQEKYNKLMKFTFENLAKKKTGQYMDEKTPCFMCGRFIFISAFLYAYKNGIPYILYCMDPVQMLTWDSDAKVVIKEYIDWLGVDLCNEVFSFPLEELIAKEPEELPKIVFPFFPEKTTYDKDKIIEELKGKGLYSSSPMRTHCTLFGLLNYFSLKNWGCIYYKLDYAAMARSGWTTKEAVLNHEKEMRLLVWDILNNKKITENHKKRFMKSWNEIGFDDDPNYLYELVSHIKHTIKDLNIDIATIE